MKKLTISLILISNISLAQTFNFACDYNTDTLYSSILLDSNLDTRDVLEVFIDDAIRHNYKRSLQSYLDGEHIEIVQRGHESLNGFTGYASWNCGDGNWNVILDSGFWFSNDMNFYKLTFLYHELGHALLQLNHSTNEKDIMYPTVPELTYSEFRVALIRLFGEVNQNLSCKGYKTFYDEVVHR